MLRRLTTLTLRVQYLGVGLRRTIRHYVWVGLGRCWQVQYTRTVIGETLHPCVDATEPSRVIEYRGPLTIEPRYGWAIVGNTTLIRDSLTYGDRTSSWRGREWIGLPGLRAASRRRGDILDAAISITSPWPENYFHFCRDVLPKLALLETTGHLDNNTPVLVSGTLAQMSFFEGARRLGRLAQLEIHALTEAVRTRSLVIAHAKRLDRDVAAQLRSLVGLEHLTGRTCDRIFITRSPRRGRLPINIDEIEALFVDRGFEIVDLDALTFEAQLLLFRNARVVAGIHGAGLANLIWCPHPVHVLELVPRIDGDDFDCFRDICSELGHAYQRVLGVDQSYEHKRASFDVRLADVEYALNATLNHAGLGRDT
jgi:capsular polysaccharide biosynthesis protein